MSNTIDQDTGDMKSKMFTGIMTPHHREVALRILDDLIYSDVDEPGMSDRGIALCMDHPCRKHVLCNLKRPAVLRQYYGLPDREDNTIYAYGVGSGCFSVGTSSRHLVVRPFTEEIQWLVNEVYKIVAEKLVRGELKWGSMKLEKFNTATILLYYGKYGVKATKLGAHRDQLYRANGFLCPNANSQSADTPTVLFTVGDPRTLHFILSDDTQETRISSMEVTDGSVFVLHCDDEKYQLRSAFNNITCHKSYIKHGDVTFTHKDGFCAVFALRHVHQKLQMGQHGRVYIEDTRTAEKLDEMDEMLEKFISNELINSIATLRNSYREMTCRRYHRST